MKRIYDTEVIRQYIDSSSVTDLFSGDITGMLELVFFQKGEYLFREGIYFDHIFFLIDGEVKVYSSIGNGYSQAYGYFPSFRILGEISCLFGDPATATAQCAQPCHCFAIPMKYRGVLLKDVRFLQYVCNILRNQFLAVKEQSHTRFYPLESRLASLILQHSKDGILQYKLVTCSELLSTSYRHLQRVISSFCQQGLLEKNGSHYHIADQKKLEELASKTYKIEDH